MLGITPADLEQMTIAQIVLALHAKMAYDDRRDRAAWERMRTQAYFTISPYVGKGRKMTPQTLVPLPWDETKERVSHEGMTTEELRDLYADDLQNLKE